MSPWSDTQSNPEERWHEWWAWRPLLIRQDRKRILVFFETVWRRRTAGRWEYELLD